MNRELLTLSRAELKRVSILERVLSGSMTCAEATESLGISLRHLRRLKAKYKAEGSEGLIHGNRGRKPGHALPEEVKLEVLRLFEEKYYDTNFCHCSELLGRFDNLTISPSSVERILKASGKKAKHPRKRRPKRHKLRDRRSQAGMLWQIDATPYEWLGAGFGKFALHASIDDADGKITGACFMQNECREGYSKTMRQGITRYGVPLALYSDKHSIFRSRNERLTLEEELDGIDIPLSNFGKAMKDLGIEHIKATTPQAKGRVERLWETLQDRLPAEMRLLGIDSIEDANAALPVLINDFNTHFGVLPAEGGNACQALDKSVNLDYVFTKRETRIVGSGSEISYKNSLYVPCAGEPNPETRTVVEVRETFSGEVLMWYKGQAVKVRKIGNAERLAGSKKETAASKPADQRTSRKPASNHPWREYGKRVAGTVRIAAAP